MAESFIFAHRVRNGSENQLGREKDSSSQVAKGFGFLEGEACEMSAPAMDKVGAGILNMRSIC